jgi:hypothetical protein
MKLEFAEAQHLHVARAAVTGAAKSGRAKVVDGDTSFQRLAAAASARAQAARRWDCGLAGLEKALGVRVFTVIVKLASDSQYGVIGKICQGDPYSHTRRELSYRPAHNRK